MKKEGVVKEFDGYCGLVIDATGVEYLLLLKELGEPIDNDDEVIFEPEIVPTSSEDRFVARFVRKLTKDKKVAH